MVINREKIQKTLQRLIECDMFSQSEVNVFILKLLVESYLNKDNVKETIIEVALSENLKNGQSFEGKVRVYMFNLRKKLDEYYAAAGAKDELIFEIKKGQYNLSITKNPNVENVVKAKGRLIWLYITLPLLLLVALSTYWLLPNNREAYCWSSFFEDNANTICFVGDHFATKGRIEGKLCSVYFEGVNSKEDFNRALDQGIIDSTEFLGRDYSFVTKMGPICAARIATWFAQNETPIDVRMESDFVEDNVLNNNIVYIGPFKTFSHLDFTFLKNSKQFSLKNAKLYSIERERFLNLSMDKVGAEYVMVSFHELTDVGRKILFFAGDHDIGVMATVNNFTNTHWLESFYEKLPSPEAHYNALFLVHGIGRTNIESELIELEVLE